MLIGYARVSTADQCSAGQEEALARAGCERIFVDHSSRAQGKRRELRRAGDTLVVWALDRLGLDLRHLLQVADDLERAGVGLRSLREGLDTTGPAGRLVFAVLGTIGEFERERIRERTHLGVLRARQRCGFWGSPPALGCLEKVEAARALLREGRLTKPAIAKTLGVSVSTLYRVFPGGDPDAIRPAGPTEPHGGTAA